MDRPKNLRIPGPTTLYPQVQKVMGGPAFNHRGPAFAKLLVDVSKKLKKVFDTKNDVLILTSSGTGGLEAAVVNILSPGDKVIAVSIGHFGERFSQIAQIYGADVTKLSYPWGSSANPADIENALKKNNAIKAVLVTHNETATGAANDLEAISKIVKKHNALLIVDAISSLGAISVKTDKWNCDVVITASQKGFGVPPGLALIALSPKAWKANEKSKMPKYYWDLKMAKNFFDQEKTPFTPATHQIDGLNVALDLMLKEGLANIRKRHSQATKKIRAAIKSMGLELLTDEKSASQTVTAVRTDKAPEIISAMRKKGIEIAGGYGPLAGKIFRIGHLGFFTEKDIDETLNHLRKVIK